MPFITNLQSFFELRLTGIGPPDLVSIAAELLVAAVIFGPIAASFSIAGWLLKRSAAHHPEPPPAKTTATTAAVPATTASPREAQAA